MGMWAWSEVSTTILIEWAAKNASNDVARQISIAVGDFTGTIEGEILGDLGGTGPPNPRSAVAASDLGSIPAGWHHAALTSDASGHKFYFDGTEYTPTLFFDGLSATSNFWPLDAAITWIGGVGSSDNVARPYAVDDVYIYDRALANSK